MYVLYDEFAGCWQKDEEEELIKRAQEGMNAEECQFSVEFPVKQEALIWSDKYRPRKPRFFNRVHTVYCSHCSTTFISFLLASYILGKLVNFSLHNPETQANSAFHPFGVGKWVPAVGGKASCRYSSFQLAGQHVSVQVKLWDSLRTRAIPDRFWGDVSWRCTISSIHTFTFIFVLLH